MLFWLGVFAFVVPFRHDRESRHASRRALVQRSAEFSHDQQHLSCLVTLLLDLELIVQVVRAQGPRALHVDLVAPLQALLDHRDHRRTPGPV